MSPDQDEQRTAITERSGLFADIVCQLRLIWRLYFDPRVPLWVKAIPTASLAYLIWPVDVVPELVLPLVGALDDLGIIALGLTTFVNLCPPDVVEEHRRAISGETGRHVNPPGQANSSSPPSSQVIDVPYTIKSDDKQDTPNR
ncbi:MAG: DUF1232 domain-containing protein [Thermoflexales bacterium]|nr:DUF1232 domain-containing protein [Thermoflexales bacterium]